MRLTKKQQAALDYFGLVFAKSEERGAGWFAYDDSPYGSPTKNNYPGSSCECIEDVVEWYEVALQKMHPTELSRAKKSDGFIVDG